MRPPPSAAKTFDPRLCRSRSTFSWDVSSPRVSLVSSSASCTLFRRRRHYQLQTIKSALNQTYVSTPRSGSSSRSSSPSDSRSGPRRLDEREKPATGLVSVEKRIISRFESQMRRHCRPESPLLCCVVDHCLLSRHLHALLRLEAI